MKVGIFGLKGSGKTTVFNSLTGLGMAPHRSGEMLLGTVKVPDERVDYLASVYHPRKVTHAELVLADTAGAANGNLAPRAAADLRTMDVLTLVVRDFDSPLHEAAADPLAEFATMGDELILEDLAVVEKRMERLAKERGKHGSLEEALLSRCREHLEDSQPLRTMELTGQELELLRGFQLLSLKRLIVLLNTPEDDPRHRPARLSERVESHGASLMPLSAAIEAEIMQLEAEERREFLADLGLEETARERYLRHAYRQLGLISFLTVGPDECRAWTIRAGTLARRAAGVIHSDIERGFIRAEVISFEDFRACGGTESAARAAGRYRLEGKDYLVRDGDIINFRFNV